MCTAKASYIPAKYRGRMGKQHCDLVGLMNKV